MFRFCKLCQTLGESTTKFEPMDNKEEQNREAMTAHAKTHQRHMKFSNYKKVSLDDVFKKCFLYEGTVLAESNNNPEPVQNRKSVANSLKDFCSQLFSNRDRKAPVGCSKCGLQFNKVFFVHSLETGQLIRHACIHLKKPLFTCSHCNWEAKTLSNIRNHIVKKHELELSEDDYNDLSPDYHDDIKASLEQCFGPKNVLTTETISREQRQIIKAENIIRSQGGWSSQHADRIIHCCRLIRKFRQPSGKVQCRLCSALILVCNPSGTQLRNEHAMHHSLSHLHNYPIYRCRKCGKTGTTSTYMRQHVSRFHYVSGRSEYDDHSDDFHVEIMSVLSRCYDYGN